MGVFGFLDSMSARPLVLDEAESEVGEVSDGQRGITAEESGTAR